MNHFNNNCVCAIDIETTGLDPLRHEIWQIAILPLDKNLNFRQDVNPFFIEMKPEKTEDMDEEAIKMSKGGVDRAMINGHDKLYAIELLEKWIGNLKMTPTKYGTPRKLIPLGHNYAAFDKPFIEQWLGIDLYNLWFHWHIRDTLIASVFLNDKAGIKGDMVAFNKVDLKWLCTKCNVILDNHHNSLADAAATAKLYKELIKIGLV